jgi:hypothetical protein
VGLTKAENEARHNKWLDDIAIRLLCVFALDRFGDFVSDQVKKLRNILILSYISNIILITTSP